MTLNVMTLHVTIGVLPAWVGTSDGTNTMELVVGDDGRWQWS
jgi:hypothetical protein